MGEQEKAREHLRDLLKLEEGLTDWEVAFIEKMANRRADLKPGQVAKIYEIYETRS